MFNAIKYTKELERAGFTRKQAEVTLNMIHSFSQTNLATREDFLKLRHELMTLEYRLTIKMGAMLVVAVGAIVALQKIL